MLIKEIKDELNKYKEDELKLIICELYKSIPKAKREEKDIDQIIKDFTTYKSIGKSDGKLKEDISIDTLKQQIELFIEYAYKQYYFAPNQYVHKKERPKWRFMVKEYIRKLESIPALSEEGRIATETVFRLCFELCEYDEAIQYFHQNHKEWNKEVALYVLLELIYEYDLKDYWVREYDRAVSIGVDPRKELREIYRIIKETGEFPVEDNEENLEDNEDYFEL